jgi:integrase
MTVKRSTRRREIIPTTPEQRQAFADGLGVHGLAVWVMHGTGMRAGECLGLYGSDFRDGFATVRVQRQAQHGHSAPLKARREGAFRDVPVPAWLAVKVKAHCADHGLGPLFPGNVSEFVRYRMIAEKIKATADTIGLPGSPATSSALRSPPRCWLRASR